MPFPEYLLGVWHCPRCGKRRKDERCGHAFHSLVGGRAGNEWQYSGASTAMGKEALSLTVEGTSRRGSWRKRCRMWGAGVRGAERTVAGGWCWTGAGPDSAGPTADGGCAGLTWMEILAHLPDMGWGLNSQWWVLQRWDSLQI